MGERANLVNPPHRESGHVAHHQSVLERPVVPEIEQDVAGRVMPTRRIVDHGVRQPRDREHVEIRGIPGDINRLGVVALAAVTGIEIDRCATGLVIHGVPLDTGIRCPVGR